MNILIYGIDVHGTCVEESRYFLNSGCSVRVANPGCSNTNSDSISFLRDIGVQVFCGKETSLIEPSWPDIVIRCQSFHSSTRYLDKFKNVKSDYGLLLSSSSLCNSKIIAITGSRGKTTAAGCIYHALCSLGKKTHLCGSCGRFPISELEALEKGDIPEYLVVAIPMTDLKDLVFSGERAFLAVFTGNDEVAFRTAVTHDLFMNACGIIFPGSMSDSATALTGRKRKGLYNTDKISGKLKSDLSLYSVPYVVLRKSGFSDSETKQAIKSYKGVPNCNELVLRTDNAIWCNSSCSDIPESVSFSMANFAGLPVYLICGGDGDMEDISAMASALKTASTVCLLPGTFTDRCLIPFLKDNSIKFLGPFKGMKQAVDACRKKVDNSSAPLQVVLLSPGAQCYRTIGSTYDRGVLFSTFVKS